MRNCRRYSGESNVADPDPGSGTFLTPGYGIRDRKIYGSGIWDKHPGSNFQELSNSFLGYNYKYLNFLLG
jgi:hypothetical protein